MSVKDLIQLFRNQYDYLKNDNPKELCTLYSKNGKILFEGPMSEVPKKYLRLPIKSLQLEECSPCELMIYVFKNN